MEDTLLYIVIIGGISFFIVFSFHVLNTGFLFFFAKIYKWGEHIGGKTLKIGCLVFCFQLLLIIGVISLSPFFLEGFSPLSFTNSELQPFLQLLGLLFLASICMETFLIRKIFMQSTIRSLLLAILALTFSTSGYILMFQFAEFFYPSI